MTNRQTVVVIPSEWIEFIWMWPFLDHRSRLRFGIPGLKSFTSHFIRLKHCYPLLFDDHHKFVDYLKLFVETTSKGPRTWNALEYNHFFYSRLIGEWNEAKILVTKMDLKTSPSLALFTYNVINSPCTPSHQLIGTGQTLLFLTYGLHSILFLNYKCEKLSLCSWLKLLYEYLSIIFAYQFHIRQSCTYVTLFWAFIVIIEYHYIVVAAFN